MKNFGLKVLAVAIALSLYLFVHSQNNSSIISLVVPVELRNLPTNKVVILPALRQAQVSIKGPSFMLREVAISAPTFRIDLPPELGDRFDVVLTGADLALPSAIEVVSISPSKLELIFDSIVTKKLPLEVPKIGSLPEDYELSEIRLEPSEIEVTGPETELRGLTSIPTRPLDLRAISGDSESVLAVRGPGSLTKTSIEQVKVFIKVNQIQAKKKFSKLKIQINSENNAKYNVSPEEVNIVLVGPKSKLAGLTEETVKPYISINADNSKQNELPIVIDLPDGVSIANISPEKVKLIHKRVG
jgi:YbbR domain-containing protein